MSRSDGIDKVYSESQVIFELKTWAASRNGHETHQDVIAMNHFADPPSSICWEDIGGKRSS